MPDERKRVMLTNQDVAFATEPREGNLAHPAVSVLRQNLPRILELEEHHASAPNFQVGWGDQGFIAQNYGFLADKFVQALPYTLAATDIVQIWSSSINALPNKYTRGDIAGMAYWAYAVQDFETPEWKSLPRHYLETMHLPDGILGDRAGLLRLYERLEEVMASYFDLEFYDNGEEGNLVTMIFDLRDGPDTNSEVTKAEIKRLKERIDEAKRIRTPLMREILENTHSVRPLQTQVRIALEALGEMQ